MTTFVKGAPKNGLYYVAGPIVLNQGEEFKLFVHPKFDSPKDSKATEHGGSFLDFASVVVHLGVKGTHS